MSRLFGDEHNTGIVSLVFQILYNNLQKKVSASIKLNFVEIKEEKIRDLLSPALSGIEVREEKYGDIFFSSGLLETKSSEEAMLTIKHGLSRASSGSYLILKINIAFYQDKKGQIIEKKSSVTICQINCLQSLQGLQTKRRDLGLEKFVDCLRAVWEKQQKLDTHRLTNKNSNFFIPYRLSKLTRCLAPLFSGFCSAVFITELLEIDSQQLIHQQRNTKLLEVSDCLKFYTLEKINKSTGRKISMREYNSLLKNLKKINNSIDNQPEPKAVAKENTSGIRQAILTHFEDEMEYFIICSKESGERDVYREESFKVERSEIKKKLYNSELNEYHKSLLLNIFETKIIEIENFVIKHNIQLNKPKPRKENLKKEKKDENKNIGGVEREVEERTFKQVGFLKQEINKREEILKTQKQLIIKAIAKKRLQNKIHQTELDKIKSIKRSKRLLGIDLFKNKNSENKIFDTRSAAKLSRALKNKFRTTSFKNNKEDEYTGGSLYYLRKAKSKQPSRVTSS